MFLHAVQRQRELSPLQGLRQEILQRRVLYSLPQDGSQTSRACWIKKMCSLQGEKSRKMRNSVTAGGTVEGEAGMKAMAEAVDRMAPLSRTSSSKKGKKKNSSDDDEKKTKNSAKKEKAEVADCLPNPCNFFRYTHMYTNKWIFISKIYICTFLARCRLRIRISSSRMTLTKKSKRALPCMCLCSVCLCARPSPTYLRGCVRA